MKVLKITEKVREELNDKDIVICTYIDVEGNEFDGISYEYIEEYPDLEDVETQSGIHIITKE